MKEIAHVPFAALEIRPTEQTPATPPGPGIRALMLAVLEDGIHSLSSSQSVVRAAADTWMMSSERRYVFSFAVICETLDLVPSAVRRSIIGLVKKNTKHPGGRLLKRSRPNIRQRTSIQLPRPERGDRIRPHALPARVA